jgi:hypothetical protein
MFLSPGFGHQRCCAYLTQNLNFASETARDGNSPQISKPPAPARPLEHNFDCQLHPWHWAILIARPPNFAGHRPHGRQIPPDRQGPQSNPALSTKAAHPVEVHQAGIASAIASAIAGAGEETIAPESSSAGGFQESLASRFSQYTASCTAPQIRSVKSLQTTNGLY